MALRVPTVDDNGLLPPDMEERLALTDAKLAAQVEAPATGAAIDKRINQQVAPQVQQITADYIAGDRAVVDAAAAAVDASPKIVELEARELPDRGRATAATYGTAEGITRGGRYQVVLSGDAAALGLPGSGAGDLNVYNIGSNIRQEWTVLEDSWNVYMRVKVGANWLPWQSLRNNLREYADSKAWRRPAFAGGNLDALRAPGQYPVSNWSAANLIRPALPIDAVGAGTLEVLGEGKSTVYRWSPSGASDTLNGVWQAEFTASSTWTAWHRLDQPPVANRARITCLGDSLTQGTDVSGAWPASDSWPGKLAAHLPQGVAVNNAGRAGETVDGVLMLAGALDIWVEVTGGIIPASGSVGVTTRQRVVPPPNRAYSGNLAGVVGSLVHDNGAWTFTRSGTGAAVPVAPRIKFAASVNARSTDVLVYWAGRNNIPNKMGMERTVPDHIVAGAQRIIEWSEPRNKSVLVAGVTTASNEKAGSANYAMVTETNQRLRSLMPGRFVDVQHYLVNSALSDMGLTPTSADAAAVAAGEIPPQLYAAGDTVHFSKATAAALAQYLFAPHLLGRGYA